MATLNWNHRQLSPGICRSLHTYLLWRTPGEVLKNNICGYEFNERDPFIIFEGEKNKEDRGEF